MALLRFIAGLIGLALLVGGTVYGILGFWGLTRGTEGAEMLVLGGIVAAIVGGVLVVRAPRFEMPQKRPTWDPPGDDEPAEPVGPTPGPVVMMLAILGFVLFVGGALYLVLGLWGMTRGGFDAWKFALLGTIVAIAGAALLLGTIKEFDQPKQ
jgi:hypothetical protein